MAAVAADPALSLKASAEQERELAIYWENECQLAQQQVREQIARAEQAEQARDALREQLWLAFTAGHRARYRDHPERWMFDDNGEGYSAEDLAVGFATYLKEQP